jgi:hypothetical protein
MRVTGRYLGHRVDEQVLRRLVGEAPGPVRGDLDRRAVRVQTAAQRLVGVRTGTLLASIRREDARGAGGPAVDVTAGIPGLTTYLGYEHYGTGPHVIRPRRRKALRFIAGGRVVFASRVQHPGTRGSRFLTRALNAAR